MCLAVCPTAGTLEQLVRGTRGLTRATGAPVSRAWSLGATARGDGNKTIQQVCFSRFLFIDKILRCKTDMSVDPRSCLSVCLPIRLLCVCHRFWEVPAECLVIISKSILRAILLTFSATNPRVTPQHSLPLSREIPRALLANSVHARYLA